MRDTKAMKGSHTEQQPLKTKSTMLTRDSLVVQKVDHMTNYPIPILQSISYSRRSGKYKKKRTSPSNRPGAGFSQASTLSLGGWSYTLLSCSLITPRPTIPSSAGHRWPKWEPLCYLICFCLSSQHTLAPAKYKAINWALGHVTHWQHRIWRKQHRR